MAAARCPGVCWSIGAGEAGAMVVREMQRNPHPDMHAVGFLDDDGRKHGKRIYGTLVLGPTADVERIVKVGRPTRC